jgi:chromosome segregation ATPase
MAPIDTESIESEIETTLRRRQKVEEKVSAIESKQSTLTELSQKREQLKEQIAEKESELSRVQERVDGTESDASHGQQEEAEKRLEELNSARETIEDIRYQLETEQESVDASEAERADLEAELEELPSVDSGRIEELEAEVRQLRDRKSRLDAETSSLQNVVQFNERMLDPEHPNPFETVAATGHERDATSAVTDQLVTNEKARCWTCGTEVQAEQIEETVEQLRDISREQRAIAEEIQSNIDELTNTIEALQTKQNRKNKIEQRIQRLESELTQRKEKIERLKTRREELKETILDLETEVEELQSKAENQALEARREANQLEFEIRRLEEDLDNVEEKIADIVEKVDELDELRAEREELSDYLTDLRTRVERTERSAVTEFNDQMETVLNLLNYDNIDRVWLERVEQETRQGRSKVTEARFNLHVVRSVDDGTAYEDTVQNLSESEREVVGLVFALAGYLTHEVYEQVPFMLLDSLEAIDSERIAAIVDHFKQYADYLIVALLEEDAEALANDYQRIREI